MVQEQGQGILDLQSGKCKADQCLLWAMKSAVFNAYLCFKLILQILKCFKIHMGIENP